MRMRILFLVAFGILALATSETAHAICSPVNNDRRLFVGQPPDLFFTAGVDSVQHIPQVWINYDNTGEPADFTDCGVTAVSGVSGVTLQTTYCDWDQPSPSICPFGQSVGVDIATDNNLHYYRNYVKNHIRPIAIHYDGTSPGGTSGTVEFYETSDSGIAGPSMGHVNIYIVSGTPPSTWFTATAAIATITADGFSLDSPFLNGQPGAKLFITHVYAGTYWNHPTAVTYDAPSGRWRIRNEDGTPMPTGLSFNVRIDPSAISVSRRTSPATAQVREPVRKSSRAAVAKSGHGRYERPCNDVNYLIIDDPVANGNPYATLLITPWSSGTTRLTHPFAVAYVSPHWVISVTDGKPMGLCYNRSGEGGFFVKIIGASQYADDDLPGDASGFQRTNLSNGVGTDINGPHRINGNTKVLSDFCWTTKGLVPLIITQNETALPPPAPHNYNTIDPGFFGVSIRGSIMTIYNETPAKRLPDVSAFNVWSPYRTDCLPTDNISSASH